MPIIKLCKDCKWIERNWFGFICSSPKCLCPRIDGIIHMVTGETRRPFAEVVRYRFGVCGSDGKYWEAI